MTPVQLLWLGKIGAVVAFVVAVYGLGHHHGEQAVQARWDASKVLLIAAQDQMIADHAKDMEKQRLEHEANNIAVSIDHQKALDEIATKNSAALAAVRAAGGLRINRAAVCGPAVATTEAASDSGHHEDPTATVQLPDRITSELFSEARRADEVVEQARACQNWILKQGFYSVPAPLP
jgi:hypothetical protein